MPQNPRKLTFEELQAQKPSPAELTVIPVSLVIDNIRSLHNVGALFRTADAVRLEHLYLCGITGIPPRDEIRKTSLGAEESVSWSYHESATEIAARLRQKGYQIVCLEQTTDSRSYRAASYHFPLALIIGHEFNGVQNDLVRLSDLGIEIPMNGIKHSLNVSVAFGVAVYEIFHAYTRQTSF